MKSKKASLRLIAMAVLLLMLLLPVSSAAPTDFYINGVAYSTGTAWLNGEKWDVSSSDRTEGWSYRNDILVLDNFIGDSIAVPGSVTVYINGSCSLRDLDADILYVRVMPQSKLEMKNSDGSCIFADVAVIQTAEGSELLLESQAEKSAALEANVLYIGGYGHVSMQGACYGVSARVTARQRGTVELHGGVVAVKGDLSHDWNSHQVCRADGTEIENYQNEQTILIREFLSGTRNADGTITINVPVDGKQAYLACYDSEGKLLAVNAGTEPRYQIWTFPDPGTDGLWKLFFLSQKNDPTCPEYLVHLQEVN